jgi:hypothetical protein
MKVITPYNSAFMPVWNEEVTTFISYAMQSSMFYRLKYGRSMASINWEWPPRHSEIGGPRSLIIGAVLWLSAKLLSHLLTWIRNTVFWQSKGIQSDKTHNICYYCSVCLHALLTHSTADDWSPQNAAYWCSTSIICIHRMLNRETNFFNLNPIFKKI